MPKKYEIVEKDVMQFVARVKHIQMVSGKEQSNGKPWRCYVTLESMDEDIFKMWEKFKNDEFDGTVGQVLINAAKIST